MSASIRTLVVDDEPLARVGLRALLARDADIVVVGDCADGRTASALIEQTAPELLFLDIRKPDVDGIGVLRQLGDPRALPVTVFVTAHGQHALAAFELAAVDYLLKPFTDRRFAVALERAKGAVMARRGAAHGHRERFAVRDRDQLTVIHAADIDWIEAADYYVKLHVGRRVHMLRVPLRDLERQLDPGRFVRVHRSAIVNRERLARLTVRSRGEHVAVLVDGTRLRVNRLRRRAVERALGWSTDRGT
jgi:two-component system LytT family response regulator